MKHELEFHNHVLNTGLFCSKLGQLYQIKNKSKDSSTLIHNIIKKTTKEI